MNVSADRNFLLVFYVNVHERFILLKNFLSLLDDNAGIFLVQDFSILLILHEILDPFWSDLIRRLFKLWAVITGLHNNIVDIDINPRVIITKTALKLPESVLLLGGFILFPGILIIWLHLAHKLEVSNSILVLTEGQMSRSLSIVSLYVSRITLDSIFRVI